MYVCMYIYIYICIHMHTCYTYMLYMIYIYVYIYIYIHYLSLYYTLLYIQRGRLELGRVRPGARLRRRPGQGGVVADLGRGGTFAT